MTSARDRGPTAAVPAAAAVADFATLFEFLPIGAYRSTLAGGQIRANPALARINGFDSEAEQLAAAREFGSQWYVLPDRRQAFRELLLRDGQVRDFVSEAFRHKSRERIWVSENAHLVRDADGSELYYEGTVEDITERVTAQAALAHSEQQFRLIASQMPGMAYRIHVQPDGRREYSFVSEGVRELYGVTPEAVMADPLVLHRFWHGDDRDRLQAESTAAMRSGGALLLEFRIVLDDGRVKWVQLISNSMPADDGGIVRTGVQFDVTTRKRSEAALRESDQRWKLALESTGDGVWDWDLVTGHRVYSERLRAMYGLGADADDRPDLLDDRTHPDDVAQMVANRQAHFEGRTPSYVNEHRIRCADGSWKWTLTRGMVIGRDAQGRPLRMIGTHTDITARKQAEAMQLARERAELADRAKSQMLSRVSHELRTPLNAVLGFAQLMVMDPNTDARHLTWVRQILASGEHLLGLVEDVLDLSSAQGGQLSLSTRGVALAPVIAESWTMVSAGLPEPRVAFVNLVAPDSALVALADAKRLKQVVANLLSNAVKYNRPGGQVVVEAQREAAEIVFSVRDTGCGMNAEQLSKLFRPFERLGAEQGRVEGRGIGLALSRQLVESMGGTIAVHSVPDQGSTFTVRLPAPA